MRKTIIGVMGPGEATEEDCKNAYAVGKLVAERGWVLLCGGRKIGVMDEAAKGARENSGLTVGVMPTADPDDISEAVDIPIITAMGGARNNINALSSDVVIACGMSTGTLSEIALALRGGKKAILLNNDEESKKFLKKLGGESVCIVESPKEAIEQTEKLLSG